MFEKDIGPRSFSGLLEIFEIVNFSAALDSECVGIKS